MTGFQVMPVLSDEEYRALEESIREHGVQVPITVAPDGRMVDGHHRAEIAAKFDLHCPRVTAKGDDTQLRTLAFELNNHRRQQGREARRGQVHKSLRADPHLSNREHARRTGVDHKTVQVVRDDMEACGEIPHTDTRTDSTGREQVASAYTTRPSPRSGQTWSQLGKFPSRTPGHLVTDACGQRRSLSAPALPRPGAQLPRPAQAGGVNRAIQGREPCCRAHLLRLVQHGDRLPLRGGRR